MISKIIICVLLVFSIFAENVNVHKTISGYDYKDKKEITLNFSKKNKVFIFFSATCPCSNSYFEYLNSLSIRFNKFEFVGFHSSKIVSRQVATDYFAKFRLAFPILQDKDLKFADLFKALKTPHVFVLGENNEILFHGAVADSRNISQAKTYYLENALNEINQGDMPQVAYAKALGCYISR